MGELINESTFNFNTPEAKKTKEICQQFVAVRTGKLVKTTKETKVMLARVADMEQSHGDRIRKFVNVTNLTEENGLRFFQCISEFNDQLNWGRVISVFLYTAIVLEQLKKNGKEHLTDKVTLWLAICITKHSTWIKEQGNGWNGFISTMGSTEEIQEGYVNGLFNITLGLGTLAAALYIQGH